jgi:hypothetical protein
MNVPVESHQYSDGRSMVVALRSASVIELKPTFSIRKPYLLLGPNEVRTFMEVLLPTPEVEIG